MSVAWLQPPQVTGLATMTEQPVTLLCPCVVARGWMVAGAEGLRLMSLLLQVGLQDR